MFPNPLPQKLVQTSEEALPSVHVPLIFGNDLIVLTQQDVRKIEDTRLFSISKVMPNGDLKTISAQDAAGWLQQHPKQENLLCNQMFLNFLEYFNSKRNGYEQSQQCTSPPQSQQQYSSANEVPYPQPMEVSSTPCENCAVASIEQQLQWNKFENTSSPFPMNYSEGTWTTELNYRQETDKYRQTMATCSCSKRCQESGVCKELCNKSTNTQELLKNNDLDAREQLKKKKMSYSFI